LAAHGGTVLQEADCVSDIGPSLLTIERLDQALGVLDGDSKFAMIQIWGERDETLLGQLRGEGFDCLV